MAATEHVHDETLIIENSWNKLKNNAEKVLKTK